MDKAADPAQHCRPGVENTIEVVKEFFSFIFIKNEIDEN